MCYIDLTNLYKAKIQTANCLLGIFCRGFVALFLYKELRNIFLWRHEPRKSIHLARFIYQRAFCRSSTIVILLQRLVKFVSKNFSILFPVQTSFQLAFDLVLRRSNSTKQGANWQTTTGTNCCLFCIVSF